MQVSPSDLILLADNATLFFHRQLDDIVQVLAQTLAYSKPFMDVPLCDSRLHVGVFVALVPMALLVFL